MEPRLRQQLGYSRLPYRSRIPSGGRPRCLIYGQRQSRRIDTYMGHGI